MPTDERHARQLFEAAQKQTLGPKGSWQDCLAAYNLLVKAIGKHVDLAEGVTRLLSAVEIYNDRVNLSASAPRLSEVIARLRQVQARAKELSRTLAALDDWTLDVLAHPSPSTGESHGGKTSDEELDEDRADLGGLPPRKWLTERPVLLEPIDPLIMRALIKRKPRTAPLWTERLSALERHAGRCANAVASKYGSGSPRRPDRGGRTNVEQLMHGTIRWTLAVEAWLVFECFSPGKAKGTVGGPFYKFLEALHVLAAGETKPNHAGPDEEVKAIGRLSRRLENLHARLDRMAQEQQHFRKLAGGSDLLTQVFARLDLAKVIIGRHQAAADAVRLVEDALSGKKPRRGSGRKRHSGGSGIPLQEKERTAHPLGKKPPRKT